jgi:hypothetical protein
MFNVKKTAPRKARTDEWFRGPFRDPFMGEEKPDEELMGKRKSSPRLSSAFLNADSLNIDRLRAGYTSQANIFLRERNVWRKS